MTRPSHLILNWRTHAHKGLAIWLLKSIVVEIKIEHHSFRMICCTSPSVYLCNCASTCRRPYHLLLERLAPLILVFEPSKFPFVEETLQTSFIVRQITIAVQLWSWTWRTWRTKDQEIPQLHLWDNSTHQQLRKPFQLYSVSLDHPCWKACMAPSSQLSFEINGRHCCCSQPKKRKQNSSL